MGRYVLGLRFLGFIPVKWSNNGFYLTLRVQKCENLKNRNFQKIVKMHVNPVVCPFVSFVNVCLVVLESLETIRDASRGSRRRHTSSSPRSTTGLRCHYVESLGHLRKHKITREWAKIFNGTYRQEM